MTRYDYEHGKPVIGGCMN